MQFSEGQTLIHPQHGPATVTEVLDRSVNGESRRYIQFRIHGTDLRIAVPVEKADAVGLRSVCTAVQVQELLDVLRAPTCEQEETWSRRFKANSERLRIGGLLLTAGVVRDLVRRQEKHGLSTGEKDMLKHARPPVLAELALALSLTDWETEKLFNSAILGERHAT
ncbi:CarD family transcriptional regulator [Streptomyces sp. NBC_01362]|uniref:CarD family transcriptional regulator n=1 Tax=Streptomyces sp. NBC_01362 TaxID=2903839 RepID=UPI002E361953|nr:CarD family transcriptional regulator [Streptomyces sp. NBC_01362]